jgi:hypothetical protein
MGGENTHRLLVVMLRQRPLLLWVNSEGRSAAGGGREKALLEAVGVGVAVVAVLAVGVLVADDGRGWGTAGGGQVRWRGVEASRLLPVRVVA